jgi:Inorganic pyrophosphatase
VIEAEQEDKGKVNRNDRLIAVAEQSLLYSETRTLQDLNSTVLKQIEEFFVNYQRVRNIRFTVLARKGPEEALAILRQASHKKKAA